MIEIDINTKYLVTEKNRITSKKSRIISSNQQVVRYDFESNEDINSEYTISDIGEFKELYKQLKLK